MATIERAVGLLASLSEEDQLHELGLLIVDEVGSIFEKHRQGNLFYISRFILLVNQSVD